LVGENQKQYDLAISANRDARMKGLYTKYLTGLKNVGVDLITHYSSVGKYTEYGSWGLLEYQDENINEAPK
jgi:calcineurin-like phosphoesterase